ncbi:MAG TPA: hypothetical protein GX396_07025 [Tissierellia bacterium]|jgi:hypothetical protein|nr:hypothetical protein [Tissierellia bacterium]
MKRVAIVITIIIILTIILIISLYLNRDLVEKKKEILEKAEIILKYEDREVILNKENIMLYDEEFEAVLDTSTSGPSNHTYKGIQLKDLLGNNNVNLQNKTIIIKGVDGFAVAYSSEEVLKDKNIYIAYMEDGKYLGSRESGGTGPYQSIIVSDTFSNRRCKWIIEIEVK